MQEYKNGQELIAEIQKTAKLFIAEKCSFSIRINIPNSNRKRAAFCQSTSVMLSFRLL